MWSLLAGSQEDCMRQLADFYFPEDARVLDVSYGAGGLRKGGQ